jgi:ATP-binding cassette, subfamily F, member 1
LDLNAVIWLDEYLQKWKHTLLIVSHDQNFLDSICQEILHIEDLKLISYKGNYDSFKKMEKTKFEQQVKAWEKQEKRLRELKKSGQSKTKAQETVMNSVSKRESGARSTKKEYQVKLEFVEVAPLGRPVIEVTNVHFRYSSKHPIIFDRVDFGIDMDSRICIVGPNGAGKVCEISCLFWICIRYHIAHLERTMFTFSVSQMSLTTVLIYYLFLFLV